MLAGTLIDSVGACSLGNRWARPASPGVLEHPTAVTGTWQVGRTAQSLQCLPAAVVPSPQNLHIALLASLIMEMVTGRAAAKAGVTAIVAASATLALHLLAVVIGLLIGLLNGHVLWSIGAGEAALFMASLTMAIVLSTRWRGSAGVGVAVGWFGGLAGLGAAAVTTVVACVALALAAVGLMLVSYFL